MSEQVEWPYKECSGCKKRDSEIERLRAAVDRFRNLAIAFGVPMELLLDVDCPHCDANKAGGNDE